MSSLFNSGDDLMKHRLAAPLFVVLVLALAAFTGAAFAGDGHGNGGSSNGNSANAPGHQTTAAPAAPAPATADNSTGVKPSSTTAHGQHNTSAPASSNKTKQYGNGKTAGQIATSSGHGDATLYGPGNSQPHKTSACPGGHEVDVHALKNKNGTCTSTSEKATSQKSKQGEVKSSEHAKSKSSEKSGVAAQKTEEQQTESHGVAASAHAHVTICHATGSSSNPYVRISPSAAGVFHGHLGHQDGRDIVPPFTWNGTTYSENWTDAGMAIYNAGCTVPSTSAATLTPLAPATSTPLAPATLTPATVAPATIAAGSVLGTQATVTPAVSSSAASSPTATPAAAGGVKGAAVALKPTKTKPAGGVLGTTTRLGGSVAATRLPFTGLPLWIFALVAAGLIGVGLAMRRTAANNRS
jgi:hypothetical protein